MVNIHDALQQFIQDTMKASVASTPAPPPFPNLHTSAQNELTGDGFVLLADDVIEFNRNEKLYRLRATRDRLGGAVRDGELGGYLRCAENLSGDAWVAEGAKVYGEGVRVQGSAVVTGSSTLHDDVRVCDNARVANSFMDGSALVSGTALVRASVMKDQSSVSGQAVIHRAQLRGKSTVGDSASVSHSTLSDDVRVEGDTIMENTNAAAAAHFAGGVLVKCGVQMSRW